MSYSAIIILGNLMTKEGKLNRESSSRMDMAIEAFHENQASYVITCGWAYRCDSSITIADAMKSYAVKIGGIPPNSILTERNSRDTVGDAIFSKKHIALKRQWNKFLIVTSDYHVIRTHEIFNYIYGEQYFIEVKGAGTDKCNEQLENEKKSMKAFHETFKGIGAGDDALINQRLCEIHPFYNGLIHPKILVG